MDHARRPTRSSEATREAIRKLARWVHLSAVLVVILVIILLGGIGPHFYQSKPLGNAWIPSFGAGGIGVVLESS